MLEHHQIAGLIAVRGGSKRVPLKNIRDFASSSLLEIKIQQLKQMSGVGTIYVSSDCAEMVEMANDLGTIGILRDSYYASDDVPMNEVYEHLASLVKEEHILYAHVTSPLLKAETLSKCVEKYCTLDKHYDSLATVHRLHEYIWEDGNPVNYNPDHHPRSQDLPNYYALNFAVNIISKDVMIERKNIVGKRFYPYFLDSLESVDVDTMLDFKVAEFLFKEREYEKL